MAIVADQSPAATRAARAHLKRPQPVVDTLFVDWYWIILGLGGFAAAFQLLTAAGGTKSASERMLKTYEELLADSRRTAPPNQPAVPGNEPLSTQPADGPKRQA